MRRITISLAGYIALFVAGQLASIAQPADMVAQQGRTTQTTVIKGRNGSHSFVVRLAKGPFRKQVHKVTRPEDVYLVDGKIPIGEDGGVPAEEFYNFKVTVDGKSWQIPKRLYNNYYNPNLYYTPRRKTVWAVLSKDGQRLAVGMRGGDGAGSYAIIWYLRADGGHSKEARSVEETWNWTK